MQYFGERQVRSPADTEKRVLESWIPRFQNGNPHGALTIIDLASKKMVGYCVAGAGDGPGASEVAKDLDIVCAIRYLNNGVLRCVELAWVKVLIKKRIRLL